MFQTLLEIEIPPLFCLYHILLFPRDFVARREELNLIQTYVDNGTTGTNFAREQWNCLIEDIKAGKINCIVVKDFSRIGLNDWFPFI